MSYFVVGFVCFMAGGVIGGFVMALMAIQNNNEYHVESIDKTKEGGAE